jgi:BA14K-like protein
VPRLSYVFPTLKFILTSAGGFANYDAGRFDHSALKATTDVEVSSNSCRLSIVCRQLCCDRRYGESGPIGEPLAIIKAIPSTSQSVQWRGGGWGWGPAIAGGIIGGAIVGGALAAPYGPGYYGPGYYGAPPPPLAYGPPPDDAIAYCMQRFRSFDPNSGTYLGFDGNRHPCP